MTEKKLMKNDDFMKLFLLNCIIFAGNTIGIDEPTSVICNIFSCCNNGTVYLSSFMSFARDSKWGCRL